MNFSGVLKVDNGTISCVLNGKQYLVEPSHAKYDVLVQAIKDDDAETFEANCDVKEIIEEAMGEGVEIRGNTVYYNGEPIHNVVADNIVRSLKEGFDVTGPKEFLVNLMENPSKRSVDQLFNFLQDHKLSITPDGCFLAYKCLRENYLDKHSGKYDNSPGAFMEMPRNKVDDDPNEACGQGFHCGALAYAGPQGWYYSEGNKIVIVKVNPRDVVCVPHDCSHHKVRICQYEVVGDFLGELKLSQYSGEVGDDYSSKVEEPELVELTPDDMLVDRYYTFVYTNLKGETRDRYILVTATTDKNVVGELLCPEVYNGEFRTFLKSAMRSIFELTQEDVDDLEHEYYYEDEDEDYYDTF